MPRGGEEEGRRRAAVQQVNDLDLVNLCLFPGFCLACDQKACIPKLLLAALLNREGTNHHGYDADEQELAILT